MDDKPVMVKCRSGCGKKNDMQAMVRIQKRLGLGKRLTWQCAECYKLEMKPLPGDSE